MNNAENMEILQMVGKVRKISGFSAVLGDVLNAILDSVLDIVSDSVLATIFREKILCEEPGIAFTLV